MTDETRTRFLTAIANQLPIERIVEIHLFGAIRQNDYPVFFGIALMITIAVLVANFLVDIAYGFIDPRIRAATRGER